MKLDVLICTCNDRITRVPGVLLAPRADVSYIVSMQYTDESFLRQVPEVLRNRPDITLLFLPGKGLSRNRNNAIAAATGDVALIADDDVRYKPEYFDRVLSVFQENPSVDIAQFMLNVEGKNPIKPYASYSHPYEARPKGSYINSPELAFRPARVRSRIRFNEHFGLGTEQLGCGEEEVWVHDAWCAGLSVQFFPYRIADIPAAETTGARIYTDKSVMRAKGAVCYHIYGASTWLRMVKFAWVSATQGKANFFELLYHTWSGIVYYLKHKIGHENSAVGRSE